MEDLKKYYLWIFLLCVVIQHVKSVSRIDPLVDTKLGLIKGLKSEDGQYSMFMGIPYATVDVTNPFGPATPHQGFDEVFEAYDDTAICPQVEEFNNTIVGSLDCLHVNIYVPDVATSQNPVPVLVWIHGGGFSIGFSGRFLYGPKFFVQQDIILITLNYRLGPYGFMCLDTAEVPGNQGLKDQQLALKWIKDNIDAFGGDPNKITIYGESAGAASVDLQLLYKKENLFDKIILQSGTGTSQWAFPDPDLSAPIKLSAQLGFETNDLNEALAYLATVDTDLVIAADSEANISFRPCVEKKFDGVYNLIDVHPLTLDVSNFEKIPILIGFNDDEFVTFFHQYLTEFDDGKLDSIQRDFQRILNEGFSFEPEKHSIMQELIEHFYIGDERMDESTIREIIDFGSDFRFVHPTVRTIYKYLDSGWENIYHYMFSYVGERNFVKLRINTTFGGAAHADEMGYQFDISYMSDPSPEDQLVIDRMATLWANFVKYGNPTPETSELIPFNWPKVTKDDMYYLNIDSEFTIERRPFHARMAFWDLFYELNKEYQRGYTHNEDL